MSVYTSSKQIELGSAAFRQWKASHSHCKYLHGYQLKAKFTFGCKSLDDRNWCVDFGGLDDLKKTLRDQFDHTTIVAGDDPELDTFKSLNEKGIIQLRIMDGGVGVERFAEWVFKTADTYIDEATEGRCFVINVTITEHDDNWASYSKTLDIDTTYVDEEGTKTVIINQDTIDPEPETPAPEPEASEASAPSRAAQVGSNVSQGKGNWFAGTSWGD
tara:strand:- start:123 stop:770 length:648 start_codon:yes stop_codon:yes gene_type:complete